MPPREQRPPGGYPPLTAEYILKANPDYIFLADTAAAPRTPRPSPRGPDGPALTAVKDKHIIRLNDDIASRWGPRIVDLLRTVATDITRGPDERSRPETGSPDAGRARPRA